MMKHLLATVALTGALVAVAAPVEAHDATFSDDCTGVTINAVRYNPEVTNHWSITINGVTQSGTFGSTFNQTFPVPQGGATTSWSAFIDAPDTKYDRSGSGTVGPCGEVPPPPPPTPPTVVTPPPPAPKHARVNINVVDKCNCYRDKVTAIYNSDHVRVRVEHPTNTLWVIFAHGRTVDGVPYLLPDTIGGHQNYKTNQVYKVRTLNQTCPCVKRGDCHALYPDFTPPQNHCRGRDC